MKKYIIHLIPVVLCCTLLFSVFTPVSAAYQDHVVDLMTSGSIMFGYSRTDLPNEYSGLREYGRSNVYFKWNPSVTNLTIQFIYINVYSSTAPDALGIAYNDTMSLLSGTLVGTYDSVYQYKFACGVPISSLTLRVKYPDNGPNIFSIVSAQGYSNVSEPLTKVNVYGFMERMVPDSSNNNNFIMVRDQFLNVTGGNGSLPYSYEHSRTGVYNYDYYYFDVRNEFYNLDSYESVTFVFDYVGKLLGPTVSLYGASSDDPVYVFDNLYVQTFAYSTVDVGSENSVYTPITTQITVDLSGIDLSMYTIDLCIGLSPVDLGGYNYSTYINLRSAYFTNEVHEPTWYETFFQWIKDLFAGDPTGGAAADQGQDMQDSADEFSGFVDKIETVPEPTFDVNSIYEGLTGSSGGAEPEDKYGVGILRSLVAIPQVESFLTIAFCAALFGFVIYGLKF